MRYLIRQIDAEQENTFVFVMDAVCDHMAVSLEWELAKQRLGYKGDLSPYQHRRTEMTWCLMVENRATRCAYMSTPVRELFKRDVSLYVDPVPYSGLNLPSVYISIADRNEAMLFKLAWCGA
jgi:phage-related protein